jgi:transposase
LRIAGGGAACGVGPHPGVHNAIKEPWSKGQAEGQINKLKTLKRSMYGRAGLIRCARLIPIEGLSVH